jgi:hypothetical protein
MASLESRMKSRRITKGYSQGYSPVFVKRSNVCARERVVTTIGGPGPERIGRLLLTLMPLGKLILSLTIILRRGEDM